MVATVLWVYVGSVLWSMRISVSSSRTLPISDFVGLRQYARLFDSERWVLSLQNMALERKKNPGYQYSVVAFTDGENNQGRSFAQFKRDYAQLPEDARAIPVFMVLFGEANEKELRDLVQVTGGRLFDARRTPLYNVFKDIRAFQ